MKKRKFDHSSYTRWSALASSWSANSRCVCSPIYKCQHQLAPSYLSLSLSLYVVHHCFHLTQHVVNYTFGITRQCQCSQNEKVLWHKILLSVGTHKLEPASTDAEVFLAHHRPVQQATEKHYCSNSTTHERIRHRLLSLISLHEHKYCKPILTLTLTLTSPKVFLESFRRSPAEKSLHSCIYAIYALALSFVLHMSDNDVTTLKVVIA